MMKAAGCSYPVYRTYWYLWTELHGVTLQNEKTTFLTL